MKHFTIITENGPRQVEARGITIAGIKCFIRDAGLGHDWDITHLETGMLICEGERTRKHAIETATRRLKTEPERIEKGREEIRRRGYELPVNRG